jgi:hypothetical protein
VYDVAGKQVLKQTLSSNTDNVKTSDLNTGLYLVNVQSAQGEAYQTKLSISHQ